jgi:hypothetical protein
VLEELSSGLWFHLLCKRVTLLALLKLQESSLSFGVREQELQTDAPEASLRFRRMLLGRSPGYSEWVGYHQITALVPAFAQDRVG